VFIMRIHLSSYYSRRCKICSQRGSENRRSVDRSLLDRGYDKQLPTTPCTYKYIGSILHIAACESKNNYSAPEL